MHGIDRVPVEDACLDCCGTGDGGPLYSDTLGMPYRLSCRTCHGSGRRGGRCGLAEIAIRLWGIFLFGCIFAAAWVMTP